MAKNRTIGSGGDDADIPTWEAQIDDSTDETGTCIQAADLSGGSGVVFNAANTAGRTYKLTADASSEVNAPTYTAATTKARIELVVGEGEPSLDITGTGWIVERVAITNADGQALRTSQTCTLRRLVIKSNTAGIRVTGGTTITVSNVAILKPGNAGAFSYYSDAATSNIYSTSIICNGSGIGFYAGGTVNCYGCVAQGTTSNNYFGAGGDYNVAQGTGAPGANSVNSVSSVYVNETSTTEDLALNSGSWNSIVNRSGFPSDTDTDIVGTSRPSTGADPGVWQTPSAATPTDNFFFAAGG